ncbi:MAG: phosphatidate cytidylyltransferase [Chloroflexi bacterium]|nr:phosphatidate cytidylyltransferase [Chloroflexota bacterium]
MDPAKLDPGDTLRRLISGMIGAAIVVALVLLGGLWFMVGMMIVFGIASLEYVHLMARQGHRVFGGLLLLWLALFFMTRGQLGGFSMILLMVITVAWTLVRYQQGAQEAFLGLMLTLGGAFYFGWMASHFVAVRAFPDGAWWVMSIFLMGAGADVVAYFMGGWFGRHPLMPSISPSKSWEGYIGSILIGSLWGGALMLLWPLLGAGDTLALQHGLILGAAIAAVSPLGDLNISILKRYAGVKDSSKLIPGHGGFLDRTDNMVIAVLVAYTYLIEVVI